VASVETILHSGDTLSPSEPCCDSNPKKFLVACSQYFDIMCLYLWKLHTNKLRC